MAVLAADSKLYDMLKKFHDHGIKVGFFQGVEKEKYLVELVAWLPAFHGAMDPVGASAAFKKEVQPFLDVFDATHDLLVGLGDILRGWARATKKGSELGAKIPDLTVGEDEEADRARLATWPGIFRELFGQHLPPQLGPNEVKAQLEAHRKAHEAMPHTTSGQVLKAKYDTLKKLRATGNALRKRMEKMLDGEYGEEPGSFEKKEPFGYDRRIQQPVVHRGRRKSDKKEEEKKDEAPPKTGTDDKAPPT